MYVKAENQLDERRYGRNMPQLDVCLPPDRAEMIRFIATLRNQPTGAFIRDIIENYFTPGTLPPIEKAILETRPSRATRKAQYYRDRYQKQKADKLRHRD